MPALVVCALNCVCLSGPFVALQEEEEEEEEDAESLQRRLAREGVAFSAKAGPKAKKGGGRGSGTARGGRSGATKRGRGKSQ
jgi:hypothetical protein